jgi:hypothetical protein
MYCRLSLGINDAIRNETKDACYRLNSTWFVESCANYNARIAVKSGNAKRGLRHFILACTDQESGEGSGVASGQVKATKYVVFPNITALFFPR